MYLLDFFKRLFRKANIPVIIYMVLNIAIICGVLCIPMGLYGIPVGLLIYIASLAIALSPVGEFILRIQANCKEIKRLDQREFLMPLFEEVYQRARIEDPTIAPDVRLFITNDLSLNAFATGRKTVCVTKGLMEMDPEHIKAVLGHEFGHLAHKDTDIILLISIGNLFVNLILFCLKVIYFIIYGIMYIFAVMVGGSDGIFFTTVTNFLALVFGTLLFQLWSWMGTLLCMKSSRDNEFEADEFSFRLGYGPLLGEALDIIDAGPGAKGLFATLLSTHPDTDNRVARMQQLQKEVSGDPGYKKLYGNKKFTHLVVDGQGHIIWTEEYEGSMVETPKPIPPISETPKPIPPISEPPKPVPPISGAPKQVSPISEPSKPVPPISGAPKPVSTISEPSKPVSPISEPLKPVPPKPKAHPEMECLAGEFQGMSIPITADEQILIGRDPAVANIILKNPHISRKHCYVRYFEQGRVFYVTDLSSYGTFLANGQRLEKGKSMELKPGAVICLGDKEERFELRVTYLNDK